MRKVARLDARSGRTGGRQCGPKLMDSSMDVTKRGPKTKSKRYFAGNGTLRMGSFCQTLGSWAVRLADLLLPRVPGGSPCGCACPSGLERLTSEICFSLRFSATAQTDLLKP